MNHLEFRRHLQSLKLGSSEDAMKIHRYPEYFKIQAVNHFIEKQLPVSEVTALMGISVHSLYAWIKRHTKSQEHRFEEDDQSTKAHRFVATQ